MNPNWKLSTCRVECQQTTETRCVRAKRFECSHDNLRTFWRRQQTIARQWRNSLCSHCACIFHRVSLNGCCYQLKMVETAHVAISPHQKKGMPLVYLSNIQFIFSDHSVSMHSMCRPYIFQNLRSALNAFTNRRNFRRYSFNWTHEIQRIGVWIGYHLMASRIARDWTENIALWGGSTCR